ncbi:hypothetical protein Tco_0383407, partial [Tanacetum coccineum]
KSSPRKLYKFIKCIYMLDHIPSAGDAEAFETDEAAPTCVPSPRWHTVRISIRPEAPMPFPLEEEVERLLALPPPPPSPLISLSPPSAEERLARCLAAPALPSSPLPIVPHPYGSPNHVRAPPGFRAAMGRLRASSPSTHHPLHPSPPLPPPPSSLHLPPQVPTSLPLPSSPLPPLPSSLFIPPPVDRREDIPEAELPPRKRLCLTALTSRYEVGESSTAAPRPTGGHRADYGFIGTMDAEIRRQRAEEVGYGIRDVWVDPTEAVEEVAPTTLEGVNARVTELAAVQEQDTHDIYAFHYETARLLDQEALVSREAWAHSVGLSSHVSSLQGQLSAALGQIQALQARDQTHADDREGAASMAVGLVFSFLVSDNHNNMPPRRSSATARATAARAAAARVAAAAVTATHMTANAVEQWNFHMETVTQHVAYAMDWKTLKKMMTIKYCPRELALMCGRMFHEELDEVEKYVGGLPDMIRGNEFWSNDNNNNRWNSRMTQNVGTCYECGVLGHFKRDYPKLKYKNHGNQGGNGNAPVKVYVVGNAGINPDSNVIMGTLLLNNRYASILFVGIKRHLSVVEVTAAGYSFCCRRRLKEIF